MSQAPGKIHLVTKAYLAGWARDGLLRPVHVQYGRQKLKSPSGVGWLPSWWGAANPELNAACEEACGKLETLVPDLLSDVPRAWPPDSHTRGLLAQFAALHIVRTEAFAAWFEHERERSLTLYRDQFSTPGHYARFCKEMRSDRERAKKTLRLINKIGSLIASMHWTLLRFEQPWLITSDQPVCPVPLLGVGEQQVIQAIPAGGWVKTIEIRCPLTPHLALLATWHRDVSNVAAIDGTWEQATNLNGAMRAQTSRWRFEVPDCRPPMPPAIFREPVTAFEPLSPAILPGYSSVAARVSELRHRAQAEVQRLIEDRDDKTLTIVTPERAAA